MENEKNRRRTGTKYEKIAGEFLEKQGYRILEYNFRCRYAEIDIVAKDGEYLVFCEVEISAKQEGFRLVSGGGICAQTDAPVRSGRLLSDEERLHRDTMPLRCNRNRGE